jgi:hypothetical protein
LLISLSVLSFHNTAASSFIKKTTIHAEERNQEARRKVKRRNGIEDSPSPSPASPPTGADSIANMKSSKGEGSIVGKGLFGIFKRPGAKDSPPNPVSTSSVGTQTTAPPPIIQDLPKQLKRQPILIEVRYPDNNEVYVVQLRTPLQLGDIAGADNLLAKGENVKVS